jgi:hypothetical protein
MFFRYIFPSIALSLGKCTKNDHRQEKRKRAFRRNDEFLALVNVLPALRLGALQQNLKKRI